MAQSTPQSGLFYGPLENKALARRLAHYGAWASVPPAAVATAIAVFVEGQRPLLALAVFWLAVGWGCVRLNRWAPRVGLLMVLANAAFSLARGQPAGWASLFFIFAFALSWRGVEACHRLEARATPGGGDGPAPDLR